MNILSLVFMSFSVIAPPELDKNKNILNPKIIEYTSTAIASYGNFYYSFYTRIPLFFMKNFANGPSTKNTLGVKLEYKF